MIMKRLLRHSAAFALLALGACARGDSVTAVTDGSDLLASVAVDPSIGAEPGQASLLGITMEPVTSFEGTVSAAANCVYSATTQRVECPTIVRNGLTFKRSIGYYTATGTPQPQRNADTRSANTKIDVSGSTVTPRGTLTVARASNLTVAGLGATATTHTLNGLETGTTSGTVTTDKGSVVMSETSSSKTENVVVPVPAKPGSWPISGTTTRSGSTSATRAATNESRTSSWSEKVTWSGTSVVNVEITRDGKTKSCTRDLSKQKTTCD
jgi:hypothetical protein